MTPSIKKLAAAIALISTSAYADSSKYHFDIPAQSLAGALQKLAKQTGAAMLYTEQSTAGKSSKALQGDFTPQEALSKLLLGSGLQYSVANDGTLTLRAEAADTLGVVTVIDSADDEALEKSYIQTNSSSATKTNTPIKEIPQSIQVIKRSVLDDQQNITVSEALRNVSGVVTNTAPLTPSFEQTRIRGFKAEQLVDGFTQYYNPGDRESTVNIERIEVLKGTNGILYSGGSGSPVGGVVNIASKLPKAKAFGEAGFKIGTNDYYQPYVDINQPLHNNVLFRFTGEYTNAGNYTDSIQTQRYNLNPTLTFTNNDSTSLTVQAKVSRWEQPDYQGLPATGTISGNFRIPKNSYIGASNIPDSNSEFNGVWGTLDHKFNETWSVNLKARYAQSQFDQKAQSLVGDGFSFSADTPFMAPSTWGLVNTRLYQEQQERTFMGNAIAKFDYGISKNTFLIGADHSNFDDQGFMAWDTTPLMSAFFPPYPTNGLIDLKQSPMTSMLPYSDPGLGLNNQFVDNTTYGGYTQLQSTLYDRLHLLASVRLAHVGIDFKSTDPMSANTSSASATKALPRIGAVLDVTDQFSLFVNYNEGMRGQPYANFVGKATPEESTTLEGGLKFDIAKQLTGQIAGYQIERSHVAVTDYTSPIFAAKAAGQQRSRGIETDLVWQATEAFSLLANYAYTDAKFTDNLAGVAKGNQLALVPANAGRLWANYKFQQAEIKGLSIGGGIYAQGEAYLSNNNRYKTDGYHSFDTTIAYEQKNYKIAATIKNLTDENYFQPYGYLDGRVIPAEGTTAYITGSIKY